jgi:hypothetical protein
VAATAILPHLLKRVIDRERPDRQMIHGRRHGIPRSGKPYDAFPSGHAMHVGAVASAASWASPKSAPVAWGLGGLVAATRIVLLAHWTTDVVAGLVIGALVERCLRPLSGDTRATDENAAGQGGSIFPARLILAPDRRNVRARSPALHGLLRVPYHHESVCENVRRQTG